MKIFNDVDFKFSKWKYKRTEIKFDYESQGYAIDSKNYDLVIVMEYLPSGELKAKVVDQSGQEVARITPSSEDLAYLYMVPHSSSQSGVAVVGAYDSIRDNFQNWHFEFDLNNFAIGRRLTPAY